MNSKTVGTIGRCLAMWVPLLLSGCGKTPGQFLIVKNQVPTAGCVVSADIGALYRGEGSLDVRLVNASAPSAYLIFPLLENDLPAPTAGALTDANRIALSGFDVDVAILATTSAPDPVQAMFDDVNNQPLLHYRVPWSGSVASGGGHTAASVEAFPTALARNIRDMQALSAAHVFRVDVNVRALGNRINGSIESDDFHYPITVCDGCLVANVQTCPVAVAPANLGNPCNIAQDQSVDCCTAAGGLICPSVVGTP